MSTDQPGRSTCIPDQIEANSVLKTAANTNNISSKAPKETLTSKYIEFKPSALLKSYGAAKRMAMIFKDSQYANTEEIGADLGQTLRSTTSSLTTNKVNTSETDLGTQADFEAKADPESQEVATEFTCFPKLPLELRQKIWKEACYIPRVIDLWGVWLDGTMTIGERSIWRTHMWKSYNAVPSILYTSHEARNIGLKHYSLDFGTRIRRPLGPVTIKLEIAPKIYVNWACDVICPIKYIGGAHMDDLSSKPVRYLALSLLKWQSLRHGLLDGPKLEQVWLFAEPGVLQCRRALLETYKQGFDAKTPFKLDLTPLTDGENMDEELWNAGIFDNEQNSEFFRYVELFADGVLKAKKINRKIKFAYKLVHFEEIEGSRGL